MTVKTALFKTTDLAIAAYLLAHKEGLDGTERDRDTRQMTFCFCPSSSVEDRASEYINDGAVPAKTFFHAIKDLKMMALKGSD